MSWPPQQESNLYFSLRRTALYPFNYGEPSLAILTEFLGLCKFDLRGKITGSKVVDRNHFL